MLDAFAWGFARTKASASVLERDPETMLGRGLTPGVLVFPIRMSARLTESVTKKLLGERCQALVLGLS